MSRFQTAVKLPLPMPVHFSLAIIATTGANFKAYPTFTLSYMGADEIPDDNILGDIQAFSTDFRPDPKDETTMLELTAFLQPKKELLDFSHSIYLRIPVPVLETNSMFHKIEDCGRFVVIINTEAYCYKALVDDDSGEVLEASIDYRFLI